MGLVSDFFTTARLLPAVLVLWRHLSVKRDRRFNRFSLTIRRPDRTRDFHESLARLGPSFVKLGQFMATRPDVVGPDLARALIGLQDQMAPFPSAVARKLIERSLGQNINSVFSSFDDKPVAAASIAQVHRATCVDRDGTTRHVGVKLLRPNIEDRFAKDMSRFFAFARILERFSPGLRRLRPRAVVAMLDRSARLELDLRLEAAAMSETREILAEHPDTVIPTVDWQRTSRRVLTMEWLEGTALNDTKTLQKSDIDLPKLAERLVQTFVYQALYAGFFHADMHQGNFLVLRNSDGEQCIGMLDFGITGRISLRERRYLAGILHGFLTGEYMSIAEIHLQSGYVPPEYNVAEFAQALRAIGEPIQGRPAHEISMADLLSQLFEMTELFGMRTQPQLLLLQKTMVVVEGVARGLDPNLNIWTASAPIVKSWATSWSGSQERLRELADNAAAVGRLASEAGPILEQVRARLGGSVADNEIDIGESRDLNNSANQGNSWPLIFSFSALLLAIYAALS